MNQRYNDNTKRPELKENQLGILKIYAFCQKIQQRASGPGGSATGVIYLPVRKYPKTDSIFPSEVAATLLSGSRRVQLEDSSHIVKVSSYADTLSSDVYWRKWPNRPNRQAHMELCYRNLGILERVLNQIALSNSTMEKCPSMQVKKQRKHGRTSTIEEQK